MSELTQTCRIWLRDETKPNEKRAALSPADARTLKGKGFEILVESSETRIFPDEDYVRAGCTIVATGSWQKAPKDAFILGLKELPEATSPLSHRHIYFAHAFKNQQGWKELLTRFTEGNGSLYDLEYLTDDQGRRVAAFGRWAGFAGAAVGIDLWCHQIVSPEKTYPTLRAFPSMNEFLTWMRPRVKAALDKNGGKAPRTLIMGSKGRCGTGAMQLLSELGLSSTATGWDKEETAAGGPFAAIPSFDVFVNCVLLQGKIAPFLTSEMLDGQRKLKVISDVSCDPTSPHNPIPVYTKTTTFTEPAIKIRPDLWLTAIDHLPSMLPRESTEDYSSQLLPHLMTLGTGSSVWTRGLNFFNDACKRI